MIFNSRSWFYLKNMEAILYIVHVDVYTDHKSVQYVFTQKELNLGQKKRLKLVKDNDIIVFSTTLTRAMLLRMI